MIHPYPGITTVKFYYWNDLIGNEIYYKVNDILRLFGLMRVFYFGYYLLTLSMFASDSAQRVGYVLQFTSDIYGTKASPLIVIKSWMIKHPIKGVAMLITISILIGAHTLQVIESPNARVVNYMDHRNILDCMWEVIQVMTTGKGKIT